jgi:hypothetical protein
MLCGPVLFLFLFVKADDRVSQKESGQSNRTHLCPLLDNSGKVDFGPGRFVR